jgi:hypothetical protein
MTSLMNIKGLRVATAQGNSLIPNRVWLLQPPLVYAKSHEQERYPSTAALKSMSTSYQIMLTSHGVPRRMKRGFQLAVQCSIQLWPQNTHRKPYAASP